MQNALLFEDIIQFTDFVRIFEAQSTSSKGFSLYHIIAPENPAHIKLLLLDFQKPKHKSLKSSPLLLTEVQFTLEKNQALTVSKQLQKKRYQLKDISRGSTLLELIGLIPWRKVPQIDRILFWLHDPKLMARIVTNSFRLNNDRIQYASYQHEHHESLLLLIEKPSYYLLQVCEDLQAEQVELFYSPKEGLYLEWNHEHPMQDLWERTHQPHGQKWLFFRANAKREQITPPKWSDIYSATQFKLDISAEENWQQNVKQTNLLTISLHFEPRSRPKEPDMWMLEEADQYKLERLLSLIDEQDLDSLLLSIQQDETGRRRFFLREKRLGQGRKYFDFQGHQFASYKGFHNLFLPIYSQLQPQLRRDQYRKLFQVQSGEITIFHLGTDKAQKPQLLKIKENSFKPIITLIDYIIASDTHALDDTLQHTIFDFSHYEKAPSRNDLSPHHQKEQRPTAPQIKTKEKMVELSSALPLVEEEKIKKEKKPAQKQKTKEFKVQLSDLEKQEAKLERQLLTEGQQAEIWGQLTETKVLQSKWEEAITSSFEEMWLLTYGEKYQEKRKLLLQSLAQKLSLKGSSFQCLQQARAEMRIQADRLNVTAFILHGKSEIKENINTWVQEASSNLRSIETTLRKKECWLLWQEVLMHNQDLREQARVKEDLLQLLNREGVTHHDLPNFIQNRLFSEHWLVKGSDSDKNNNEANAALDNLLLLQESVYSFPTGNLRSIGLAIIARAFDRIGHQEAAQRLIHQLATTLKMIPQNIESDTMTSTWSQAYILQTESSLASAQRLVIEKHYANKCRALQKSNPRQFQQIQELAKSFMERKERKNASAFLSKENLNRLFPSGIPDSNDGEITSLCKKLNRSFQNNELQSVQEQIPKILEYISEKLSDSKASPDYHQLAWLLNETISTLSKLKWGSHGRALVHQFNEFVEQLPSEPSTSETSLSNFYFVLLQLTASEGLVTLGSESLAAQSLDNLLKKAFEKTLVPLDYIDLCSKALNTIETLQLSSRQQPLKLIIEGMQKQVSSPQTKAQYEGPYFTAWAIKLLDQIIEVSLSKERLAFELYKQYTDQDELLLRERIFTETIWPK